MDILLIGGLWLDGSVWRDTAAHLKRGGHRAVAITLPGQGDGNTSATLADQLATVVAAVDAADGRPMVVGHSAACSLAWLAADARPNKVGRLALIGGFPSDDGTTYADFFPMYDGAMAFPGWEPFEGADSADLDDAAKEAFLSSAIPVPQGVAQGVIALTDDRRYDTPVVVVCPEFSPSEAQGWIDGGEVPELARAKRVRYVDIDSGHWPMITAPVELADLLANAADDA